MTVRVGWLCCGELTINNTIHLRARDYTPSTGTFTKRDPLPGRPGTTTLTDPYHYVNNDPLDLQDPAGTSPLDDSGANDSGQDVFPPDANVISLEVLAFVLRHLGVRLDGWPDPSPNAKCPGTKGSTVGDDGKCAEEYIVKAKAIANEMKTALLSGASGVCGTGEAAFILAGEETGCLVVAGEDEVAFMRTQGLGFGSPSAGLSATHLFSNAQHTDDMSGEGLCLGGSATPFYGMFGGTAELCLGSKTRALGKGWLDYNGVFTFTIGAAAGAKPAPFLEGHLIPGYTGVQTVCTNLVCSTAAKMLITAAI